MKAIQIIRCGPPTVLEYVDIEQPRPIGNQVLVKTESISVNYADVMIRQGIYPIMPPFPIIPGGELSGYVEAVGEEVVKVKPGQPVIFLGERCYSQYILTNEDALTPIPDSVDMDAAAALPIAYLTAYHMMHTMAQIKPSQTILTNAAAGGVGTAIIQLAKIAGTPVIGLTSTPEKVQYIRDKGIDYAINYNSEDIPKRVNEITEGKGVNLILDSVGGEFFETNFEILAPLGQIIWYGASAGPPQFNLVEKLGEYFGKGIGIRTFHLRYSLGLPYPELMTKSMNNIISYLVEKKIDPQIYKRIPLSESSKAHELMESGAVTGKLILKP